MSELNDYLLQQLTEDPGINKPMPGEVARSLWHGVTTPYRGAEAVLQQGDKLPSQMSINPGAAGLMGISALTPGVLSTRKGALGALGSEGAEASPEKLMEWLQTQAPASTKDVRNFLKESDIPFREKIHGYSPHYSYYFKTKDPHMTREAQKELHIRDPEVRFAEDQHWGNSGTGDVGSRFDTAVLPQGKVDSTGKINFRTKQEANRIVPGVHINEAGESFAKKQALLDALKWRFSRAPHGENWLVPQDAAPFGKGYPGEPLAPGANMQPPTQTDKNQLILKLLGKHSAQP